MLNLSLFRGVIWWKDKVIADAIIVIFFLFLPKMRSLLMQKLFGMNVRNNNNIIFSKLTSKTERVRDVFFI